MTPAEISLATIHLKSSNNWRDRILRRAVCAYQAVAPRRLRKRPPTSAWTTVEAENRRLRRELEEAEDKLEAITTIERSIREQE